MVAGEGSVRGPARGRVPAHPRPLGGVRRTRGRDAIRASSPTGRGPRTAGHGRVEALIRETDDPEVVVTEITHDGSPSHNAPYRHFALGIMPVDDGKIVRYDN